MSPQLSYKQLLKLKDHFLRLLNANPSFSKKELKAQDDLWKLLTTIIEHQQRQLDSLKGSLR